VFQDWALETRRALLMDAMKSSLSVLALLCFCFVSWTAAGETDKRYQGANAPQGAQLTFQTLDGDTQQVNPDETGASAPRPPVTSRPVRP
jgi:hypothetical protein